MERGIWFGVPQSKSPVILSRRNNCSKFSAFADPPELPQFSLDLVFEYRLKKQ